MDGVDSNMVQDILDKKYLKDNPLVTTAALRLIRPIVMKSSSTDSVVSMYNSYQDSMEPGVKIESTSFKSPMKAPKLDTTLDAGPRRSSQRDIFTEELDTLIQNPDQNKEGYASSIHSLAVSAALATLPLRPSSALFSVQKNKKSSNTKLLLNNAAFVLENIYK